MPHYDMMTLPISEADMKGFSIGDEVTIRVKGKVKELRGGLSPKEYEKREKKARSKDEPIPYEPPAEVAIEITSRKLEGGKFAAMAEDET